MPLPNGTGNGTGEYTSVRSPRLKAARRLTKRAFRQRARAFLVEGPQAVTEAFRSGAPVTELFVTAEARARHADLVTAMARAGIPVHTVSGEVMAELAQTVTPQGLLAVCGFVDVPLGQAIAAVEAGAAPGTGAVSGTSAAPETGAAVETGAGRERSPRLVALLASVRDPGNAGTVLRTADAAGAQAVIFSDASVDPYNGKCVRASAGSLFHLPVVAGVPPDRAVSELRGAGLRILAADARGGRTLDELTPAELAAPTAWIFGNEAWGMPAPLLALADESVAVPIYGRAESLNLATAAAVCLYACARAQHNPVSQHYPVSEHNPVRARLDMTERLRDMAFCSSWRTIRGVGLWPTGGHARVSARSVTQQCD